MNKPLCTVVGMGTGISMAVAQRFAREGFAIAMLARRPEALQGYQDQLRNGGFDSHSFPVDVAQTDSLTQAFTEIQKKCGPTQVLVYNAAAAKPGKPTETNTESLLNDFRVNVAGALAASRAVIPAMRERKQGTILFTGGGLSLNPLPAYASLAIGKAGIRSLAYSLAGELEPQGIHVATVTICGFVKPGTRYDPDLIAEEYWRLHTQQPGKWQKEVVFE